MVDDATRMKFPLVLKQKDDICDAIVTIFNKVETHTGRKIKFFRTDDEGEFKGLTATLNQKGIQWEMSAPYAQDQDGVSERFVRTILERARTMLIHGALPRKLWPEALAAAMLY
jgi:transposase InsO family protein